MREVFIKIIKKKNCCKEIPGRKLLLNRKLLCFLSVSFLIILFFAAESQAQDKTQVNTKQQMSEWQKTLANSGEPEKRAEAARLLAQAGNRKATKTLIQALSDKDKNVREQVILALGQLRVKKAVKQLINILQTSTEPREKAASAFALGQIRDRRAVKPLITELKTAGEPLRTNIVISLGRLGDPRAVEALLALPHDKDHKSCAPISIALGQIKSGVSSEKLFNWLNSEDADICPNAAIAIVLIGGKRQVIPLIKILKNKNPVSRRSAAYALGTIKDKRAVLPLIESLKDEDTQVRLNAVVALSLIKDKRAIEPLKMIEKSDSVEQVREKAGQALKIIQGENNE